MVWQIQVTTGEKQTIKIGTCCNWSNGSLVSIGKLGWVLLVVHDHQELWYLVKGRQIKESERHASFINYVFLFLRRLDETEEERQINESNVE